VADLALPAPEIAKEMITAISELKDQENLFDAEASLALRLGLYLAIRAFGGLVRLGLNNSVDTDRLMRAIESVPALGERALLWSELALRYHQSGKRGECEAIVREKLLKAIRSLSVQDIGYARGLTVQCAAAMYAGHTAAALEAFDSLPRQMRDEAVWKAALWILSKVPGSDAYDSKGIDGYNISIEEYQDLAVLMKRAESDSTLYSILLSLSESIRGRSRDEFSQTQRSEIARNAVRARWAKRKRA
jgi:hypothetical protein